MPRQLIDLTGKRFGRLTVIRQDGNTKNGSAKWLCICDCGNHKTIKGVNLRNGQTTSCGCYQKEQVMRFGNVYKPTHGHSRERLYRVWKSMLHRCLSVHSSSYDSYGGRGIKVCEEWREYDVFKEWALNNGYSEGLSIDRIDVNGNYCPDNCKFSTTKEQANNKRSNVFVEINGESKTIAQWAEYAGLPYETVRQRIKVGKTGADILKPKRGAANGR